MDWSVVDWGKNTCFFPCRVGEVLVWKTYYDLLTTLEDESSQLLANGDFKYPFGSHLIMEIQTGSR